MIAIAVSLLAFVGLVAASVIRFNPCPECHCCSVCSGGTPSSITVDLTNAVFEDSGVQCPECDDLTGEYVLTSIDESSLPSVCGDSFSCNSEGGDNCCYWMYSDLSWASACPYEQPFVPPCSTDCPSLYLILRLNRQDPGVNDNVQWTLYVLIYCDDDDCLPSLAISYTYTHSSETIDCIANQTTGNPVGLGVGAAAFCDGDIQIACNFDNGGTVEINP